MQVTLGFGDDSENFHSEPFQPGTQWQHVAFTYDGAGAVRFYRNGAPLGGGDHAAHSHLGDVAELLRSAGFTDVLQEWWGERHSLSAEEFWNVQAVFDSDARGALTACDEGTQEDLRRRYIALCEDHAQRGHQLVYRTGALIFTASKPRGH